MALELLGENLEGVFKVSGKKLSLKCVVLLGMQMIERIEYMHKKGFIHRDIKPNNFLMGMGKKENVVHVIDFGLSKRYRDPSTGNHIAYKSNKKLAGTARYVSVNTHLGVEQSRRDDLEGIIYVMLCFLRGSLPWQGLPAKNKYEKYRKIFNVKSTVSPEVLCKGLPIQMKRLLCCCRELKFEETPNYEAMKKALRDIAAKDKFTFDNVFDWDKSEDGNKEERKMASIKGVGDNLIANKHIGNEFESTMKSSRDRYNGTKSTKAKGEMSKRSNCAILCGSVL
eukprot:TRINITY_DN690_c0_g1_i7.p1 TRINITY_DN690_c0_g1~~TRINITY_DN690_c0_g1_i7.p1  ORF type:complete len:282 (-),score=37.74 TRINITY_DN690_c0_g1_i7:118-963(-)